MRKTEKHKYFKNGILVFIIVSSIALAFENPLVDPESAEAKILKVLDIIMTIIFTIEVMIKVIANGLLFNGEKSYLRKFWNILDFVIVAIAWTSLTAGSDTDLGTLKILRMGRLFRPLRVLSRNEGLKISI